jgi:hypothetical protein
MNIHTCVEILRDRQSGGCPSCAPGGHLDAVPAIQSVPLEHLKGLSTLSLVDLVLSLQGERVQVGRLFGTCFVFILYYPLF